MTKRKTILQCFIWTVIILLFPITSGAISQIFGFSNIQTLLIQGFFMFLSLIVPLVYLAKRKVTFKEVGFSAIKASDSKIALYFIPAVFAEVPFLLGGIELNSTAYFLALLFFAVAVGITEELYFRGIILRLLINQFSVKKSIWISALFFGIGHIASALSGASALMVLLQVMNAFIFGLIAAELVVISKSLFPTIVWHIAFNFINRISLAEGSTEITLVSFQVIIMISYACYLWIRINRRNGEKQTG